MHMLELFRICRVLYENNMIGAHPYVQFLVVIFVTEYVIAEMNVALGRPANQSSTLSNSRAGLCVAGRAVDGNYSTDLYVGSCAHTNYASGGTSWWRVDLGQPMYIKMVIVTSRNFAPQRLDYFLVGVTNSTVAPVRGSYPLCGQYPSKAVAGAKHCLQCNSSAAPGQNIIIQQPSTGDGYLCLCEVEVYTRVVGSKMLWEGHENQRLVTNETTTLNKRSVMQCIGECKNTPDCDSINFLQVEKRCELNFLLHSATQCDFIDAAVGWIRWTQI